MSEYDTGLVFTFDAFFFGLYPYFAFFTFVIGSAARYGYTQYEWKTSSSQLLRKEGMRVGSNLFHIGIIVVLLGHFVGLLTPGFIYEIFITPDTKQILAMCVGGFFGIMCFIGLSMLLYRRLFDIRIRVTSTYADIFVLLILYIQLLLGLISIYYSYVESFEETAGPHTMLLTAQWARAIVTCTEGASWCMSEVSWIFKTHIILGLTLLFMFPFTRLIHILSVPVFYVFRTGYQIVRVRS